MADDMIRYERFTQEHPEIMHDLSFDKDLIDLRELLHKQQTEEPNFSEATDHKIGVIFYNFFEKFGNLLKNVGYDAEAVDQALQLSAPGKKEYQRALEILDEQEKSSSLIEFLKDFANHLVAGSADTRKTLNTSLKTFSQESALEFFEEYSELPQIKELPQFKVSAGEKTFTIQFPAQYTPEQNLNYFKRTLSNNHIEPDEATINFILRQLSKYPTNSPTYQSITENLEDQHGVIKFINPPKKQLIDITFDKNGKKLLSLKQTTTFQTINNPRELSIDIGKLETNFDNLLTPRDKQKSDLTFTQTYTALKPEGYINLPSDEAVSNAKIAPKQKKTFFRRFLGVLFAAAAVVATVLFAPISGALLIGAAVGAAIVGGAIGYGIGSGIDSARTSKPKKEKEESEDEEEEEGKEEVNEEKKKKTEEKEESFDERPVSSGDINIGLGKNPIPEYPTSPSSDYSESGESEPEGTVDEETSTATDIDKEGTREEAKKDDETIEEAEEDDKTTAIGLKGR